MQISQTLDETISTLRLWHKAGYSVGLVPTMGFLHAGHLSLMHRARQDTDRVVVSIFVNPMQFGPTEDLECYPRDFEKDSAACKAAGVDLLFFPDPASMYPPDFNTVVEVQELTNGLCGDSRPGHFRGVTTVICKLFNLVNPDKAYFGQKDAQQLAVIKQLVKDLNMPVEVVGCPIVRESDGLAMSSRNAYLEPEERKAATVLYKSVQLAKQAAEAGESDSSKLRGIILQALEKEKKAVVDYVSVVDAVTMQPVAQVTGPTLLALAVYFGKTRLLDNTTVGQNL